MQSLCRGATLSLANSSGIVDPIAREAAFHHVNSNSREMIMFMNVLKAAAIAAFVLGMGIGRVSAEEKKKPAPGAQANRLEGTLKAVDVTRSSIRVVSGKKDAGGNKSEEDQTLPVAADARIVVMGEVKEKGKPAGEAVKLGDLKEGMRVMLILSENKKTVTAINAAKKLNAVTGGIKSVDAAKKSVILATKDKGGVNNEQEYIVSADILVTIAGHEKTGAKKGTLADLREKMNATLVLTEDGKSVTEIRIAAPIARGVVKEVDAAKPAITITIGAKDAARDESYSVGKDATVRIDGNEAKLADVKSGTQVELLLMSDGGVVGIRAGQKGTKVKPQK